MTSRERVHAALRREPVDRIPIFMWFHPETAHRLALALDLPAALVAEAMGNDVRQTWVGNNSAMEGVTHEHEGETHRDDWGIEWVRVGPFNQIAHSPLQNANDETILAYCYPYAQIGRLLASMEQLMRGVPDMFTGCDISPCLFEMICRLRGMEMAVLDLAGNVPIASAMLRAAADFETALATAACEQFSLDWLWTGDDVAGQRSMIMSPRVWREMIRPHLARIVEVGCSRGLWVAYHCCGSLRPIIPDLIDMGVDVLNPIQFGCPGMDPLELKREFGKELAFMGGVDTVNLLPRGSASMVRSETERLLGKMSGDGGGYILAASHTIPPETPLENIFAMYAAAGISREEIEDRAASLRTGSQALREDDPG